MYTKSLNPNANLAVKWTAAYYNIQYSKDRVNQIVDSNKSKNHYP